MINNFLIINCTGKNNSIGVKINNKFFKEKLQKNIQANNLLVSNIISFNNKYGVKLDDKYAILVNLGPGSYSSIRVSLSVAKGIKITKKAKLYSYKESDLTQFSLVNIEELFNKKLIQKKLIKPIYLS